MSPGATFERVYHELKRMLAEGELAPGTPIEPALIGKRIASSITPIRDALHRLTGERLVEAPNHNGFRVPLPSEAGLRDLYSWNAQLLVLAARRNRAEPCAEALIFSSDQDLAAATAHLFVEIARGAGSAEHVRAIQRLNDRLAPFRCLEGLLLSDAAEEFASLALHFGQGDRARLTRLLEQHRRRRLKIVPALLAELGSSRAPKIG